MLFLNKPQESLSRLTDKGNKYLLPLALFLVGIAHWAVFYNFGNLDFTAYDWRMQFAYNSTVKQALASATVPYHISEFFQTTDRFLGLPETLLSPQSVFLRWLDVGSFLVLNNMFMFAVGFLGCLQIRKRYSLSAVPFTMLFLLFNFNGYITARVSVGHYSWMAYYLLPHLVLYLLELLEEKNSDRPVTKISLVLFFIMLQGGLHIFVFIHLFLLAFALFNRRYLKPYLWILALSALLSSFRILPAAISLKGYAYISGYPTLFELFQALLTIKNYTYETFGFFGELGWWEYDVYIGILGFLALAYFGVLVRLYKKYSLPKYDFPELDWPLISISALSLGFFHAAIAMIPLPFFNSERVSSRFIIIPLVILIVLAAIRLQHFLSTIRLDYKKKLLLSLACLEIFSTLMTHSKAWRIVKIEAERGFLDPHVISIVNRPDKIYTDIVLFSSLLSLASLAAVLFLYVRGLPHFSKDKKITTAA
ncbi:MAG: hypothetical protein AB7V08_09190 [Elusimicrobiales bacterium]